MAVMSIALFDRLRPTGARLRIGWDVASVWLFVAAVVVVILTFDDYGITWDEDVHNWYGVFVLDYYLSAFKDVRSLNWLNLYNYGAAFDMIAAAVNRISPFGTYETRHLLNGLTGVLGLIGCWKLTRVLAGPRAGFIAAVFLVLTPNYYGQMFNNPKDIPFAVGATWSLYYMVRMVPFLPRPPASLVLKLGIMIGLSLGVRVGGLLLFGYLGAGLGLFVLWRALQSRPSGFAAMLSRGAGDSWRCALLVVVPIIVIAYPVMLLFWPWAQQDPIEHPLKTLEYFSHVTFPFRTLFMGQYVPATDLPWIYLPTHIVLALPELILVLALAALPAAVIGQWRRPGGPHRTRTIQYALVAIAILFPVGYAVAIRAVLFDGMRHFIFVLPPIACTAALVADRLTDRLQDFRHRRVVAAVVALYGLGHIAIMGMLHPNQYVYYNGFVGGVKGAEGLFKTDYWANSYAEAVEGLTQYLETTYGADFEDRDFTIAVCGPPISADYFFPDNFIFTDDRENADFFIAFTKDECHKAMPGKEVFRVERMGALLSVVLDRRDIVLAKNRPDPSALAMNSKPIPPIRK
jgi:hypothetical protein